MGPRLAQLGDASAWATTLVERLLPNQYLEDDGPAGESARLITWYALLGSPWGIIFGVLYWINYANAFGMAVCFAVTATTLGAVAVLHARGGIRVGVMLMPGGLLGAAVLLATLRTDASEGPLLWAMICPVLAYQLAGIRAGILWTATVVAAMAAVRWTGIRPGGTITLAAGEALTLDALGVVGFTWVVGAICWVNESLTATAHARREETRRDLRATDDRLEELGRRTSGICHDLNALITVLVTTASLLEMEADENEDLQAGAHQIAESGRRIGVLTRQIVYLSRDRSDEPRIVDFDVVIADVADLLRRTLGNASFAIELDADGAQTRIREGAIEQILMYLGAESRDCAPSGALSLRTGTVQDPEGLPRGTYVAVEISSTGCGEISEGFGLVTCREIANSAGGDVRRLESSAGGQLLLPMCSAESTARAA